MKIQKFNQIPLSIIDYCIDDYNNRKNYDTLDMKKAQPGVSLNRLFDYCKNAVGQDIEFCSGNFYKHSQPYLPHTDYRDYENNHINIVIPLSYTESKPHLIVFDQKWNQNSVTWCMQHQVRYFETNIGVKGYPNEYPIVGLTNKPIDDNLYQYINQYPKIGLFGMSGDAYPFEIGSIIVFDNRYIHCTSSFTGEKLGISLRFKML
jgi:hypothetical protein